ncbi:Amidase signature enzyme [Pseudovibrio sp. FO-BEG1]|uniref:amidase n=1 Tax=Pseudovibrio sp. (strain FO-BEG1) TaxID=911045 RepID=UPI000238C720|nr:amidase [Pseudovibrio sp. FO-BEG1]AEV37312.1 Amidase signature enzyme [Pseudovibrio sp. FO-BEG1]
MTDNIFKLTATEVAAAIRNRQISSSEVIDQHLARIDEKAHLNAVTTRYDDKARKAAELADQAVERGDELGPLHGVPVTIKENVDQEGASTNNGVKAFAGLIAKQDAPLVERLKRAGAIPIGRTNTPEMSWRFHTENVLFGQTLNPWNPALTPGGSSGGASSSLAAGIGYIAHGSDLSGSIRLPAFCCGVLGLRPSHGRIPFYNATSPAERPMTIQLSSAQGPLARSVDDLKLAYDVMRGYSDLDTWSLPDMDEDKSYPNTVALITPPDADPKINEVLKQAGEVLAQRGYKVESTSIDFIQEAFDRYSSLLITEVALQKETIIDKFASEQLRTVFEYYTQLSPPMDYHSYARALASRSHYHRLIDQFQRKYPVIIAPVCTKNAFEAGADVKSVESLEEIIKTTTYLGSMNFLDLPSMSIPSKEKHEGVPIGIQLIGPRYGEEHLFKTAKVLEQNGFISSQLAGEDAASSMADSA